MFTIDVSRKTLKVHFIASKSLSDYIPHFFFITTVAAFSSLYFLKGSRVVSHNADRMIENCVVINR